MEKIKKLMKALDCTEEEAKDIITKDKEIDKGIKHFELSKDQKQAEKKMRSVGIKTVNPYGKQTTRERPQDINKRELIAILETALTHSLYGYDAESLEIINPERELAFKFKGKKYKIVLSCPRS